MILTRRNLIQLAGVAFAPWSVVPSLPAADFWYAKEPDSWSADEIAKLLKKSPWAKEVTGERTTNYQEPVDEHGSFDLVHESLSHRAFAQPEPDGKSSQ